MMSASIARWMRVVRNQRFWRRQYPSQSIVENVLYQWPFEQLPQRVAFISDLHLMSTRSTAHEHHHLMESAISRSEMVVWGGDLFDFRWSRFKQESDAVNYSIDYLQSWLTKFPDQQFVFLCGNHDASREFLTRLQQHFAPEPRFLLAGDILQLGDTVMLHGDQIEGHGTIDRFEMYRQRWSEKKRAAAWRFSGYDAVVAARAHKVAAAIAHRNQVSIRKLARFLELCGLNHHAGIRRVIFGHTHRLVHGYEYHQMHFYSGGAAIRHVPFRPVEVVLGSV